MQPSRLLLALVLAAVPAQVSTQASAQSFFEELFGIGRARQPPPRAAPPSAPVDVPPEGPRPAPAPPAPPKPVVIRAPSDDSVIGQDLQQNGSDGSLRLERAQGGLSARITLAGIKVSQPTESCRVSLSGGAPLTLADQGRPNGVTRLAASDPVCPLRLEILDGSVLVTTGAEPDTCVFQAADCAVRPKGLWGPGPASLVPRAQEFDSARGSADKAVRENYKVLTQRAKREDIRPIVAEQAAFSSEREQMCRAYAREGVHGYCHLRFSEARALSLATRLGIATSAAPTASATPRPPRRRPPVDGMNPGFDTAGPE
ncbi:hypothetical protein [Methylobacterium isbiliense]|jgi:hypothetical protein|uniref:Lysozyme inhibitor LprI N-terminal domain-containing protein n=1 Tax=Methylobacterium isbiliense TaxID=315478 RepID=A0ABQ4S9Y3_9HYPH|nr:hypothetical protein [Methylobacterium isbiliense]MDN3625562.1 hypothetical protein [Methylobacterium isbiliense]GJD99996.1 hypothetical protein GMJLKIPL_1914 [Methylobacterium isbiliense]